MDGSPSFFMTLLFHENKVTHTLSGAMAFKMTIVEDASDTRSQKRYTHVHEVSLVTLDRFGISHTLFHRWIDE